LLVSHLVFERMQERDTTLKVALNRVGTRSRKRDAAEVFDHAVVMVMVMLVSEQLERRKTNSENDSQTQDCDLHDSPTTSRSLSVPATGCQRAANAESADHRRTFCHRHASLKAMSSRATRGIQVSPAIGHNATNIPSVAHQLHKNILELLHIDFHLHA